MWGMFLTPPVPPNPEADEEEDPELSGLIRAFDSMGFEHWTAFVLAWTGCSPSQARELLKKGATLDQVARILA